METQDLPIGLKRCPCCKLDLPNTFEYFYPRYERNRSGRMLMKSICRKCFNHKTNARKKMQPSVDRLLQYAKGRANRRGRDFNLDASDIKIPSTCPVLGIPMKRPSIDRIDNAKGYVKGNVRVVSVRANMLRNNATVAELELILEDARRIEKYLNSDYDMPKITSE